MNIGIVSYNTQRGLYHLSLLFQEALKELNYNVFTIINPNHERLPTQEFVFDNITKNNIDTIISFESNAKSSLGVSNLIQAKKELGTKLIEVPMVDCFGSRWLNSRVLDNFDSIICVSQFAYDLFNSYNYSNIKLIRPGFKHNTKTSTNNSELVYFHPSGGGGVKHIKRKNSLEVLQSFIKATEIRKDIRLLFYSQLTRPKFLDFYPNDKEWINNVLQHPQITYNFGHLSREQFIDLYNKTDILCYPTKKEGLGLCVFEAATYDIPTIVMDMPPYNEFINGNNGWLCKSSKQEQWRDFFVKLHFVDIDYLTHLFLTITKEDVLNKQTGVSKLIGELYNWELFVNNLQLEV